MKIVKNTLSVICFFILGALAASSLLTLCFWGRTRIDYLLLYLRHFHGAADFVRNAFVAAGLIVPCFLAYFSLHAKTRHKIIIVVLCTILFAHTFRIGDFLIGLTAETDIYEKEYVVLPAADKNTPTPKRNLIILYIESLENNYRDINGLNLIPRLSALADENFSFGGFRQLAYADATISAQAAGLCALPYKIELSGKNLFALLNSVLPNARCLPDILKEYGYNTYFIQSGSLAFANTDNFLRSHGFDEAEGVDELTRRRRDKITGSNWGIRDYVMYDLAKEKILQLADKRQPFLVMMATIDTHEPADFLDASCPQKYGDMRDVVLCADKMAADFIDWIKKQNFYDDTTVVVLGDHTALGKNPLYPECRRREIFNTVINPIPGLAAQNHQWTTLDLAPTILEALGIREAARGMALGRSLWRTEATLAEKYGSALDLEFNRSSAFYRRLQTPAENKRSFVSYRPGKLLKAADIGRYAEAFEIDKDIVWADTLNMEINAATSGRLCLEAEFILFFARAGQNETTDIFVNGRPIGKWQVAFGEKPPFSRKICFDRPQNKKMHIVFKRRNDKNDKSAFVSLGFRNLTIYPETKQTDGLQP